MQGITNWFGTIWGTSRGTILVQLERRDNTLVGGLTIIEPGIGTARTSVTGNWTQSDVIEATLGVFTSDSNVPLQMPTTGKLRGIFSATDNTLKGKWETDAGTRGDFIAVLDISSPTALQAQPSQPPPVQLPSSPHQPIGTLQTSASPVGPLVTATLFANAVRLDRDDLSNLVKIAGNDINVQFPVVNAIHKSREYRHLGMDSLLSEPALPEYIESVSVSADEHVIGAGQKIGNRPVWTC